MEYLGKKNTTKIPPFSSSQLSHLRITKAWHGRKPKTLFKWKEEDSNVCLITKQNHGCVLEIVSQCGANVLRNFKSKCRAGNGRDNGATGSHDA